MLPFSGVRSGALRRSGAACEARISVQRAIESAREMGAKMLQREQQITSEQCTSLQASAGGPRNADRAPLRTVSERLTWEIEIDPGCIGRRRHHLSSHSSVRA